MMMVAWGSLVWGMDKEQTPRPNMCQGPSPVDLSLAVSRHIL